jgi:hypothetical protein
VASCSKTRGAGFIGLRSCGVLTLGLILLSLGGCGGCRDEAIDQDDGKKPERQLPDFESLRLSARPSDATQKEVCLKPGHWTSASLDLRANHFDFRGELSNTILTEQGLPLALGGTSYSLETSRSAVLPKGQARSAEVTLFCPQRSTRPQIASRLTAGLSHGTVFDTRHPVAWLREHQHYFVVLAREPDSYQFLGSLDSIRSPGGLFLDALEEADYRLVRAKRGTPAPLAASALEWTTIAYLLWDDWQPADLTPAQQQALLDWLHWGGQLLVSGPETLETLRGSFLEPYLPARSAGTWDIDRAALAPLDEPVWARGEALGKFDKPWAGVKLLASEDAHLPIEAEGGKPPLVAERRVGRGRVIVSAFRLNERELSQWPGYDRLMNACLLRRPARRFSKVQETAQVQWADGRAKTAARTSGLRYFSRDAEPATDSASISMASTVPKRAAPATSASDDLEDEIPVGPGVAGWNDASETTLLARQALRDAAGIVVPSAMFVVWVLVTYIVVLVPLNWIVFRLLGRVEWAWFAAPLIAIGFTIAVVRLAELDIGFARSKTEIDVVELQAGYARAHVTRYAALYNSLGTNFELRFEDASAVALPLNPLPPDPYSTKPDEPPTMTVELHREPVAVADDHSTQNAPIRLSGFQVSSNSTGMLHGEQMQPLGGPIDVQVLSPDKLRITNRTEWTLHGSGVATPSEAAWLGDLAPGEAREVVLQGGSATELWELPWESSPVTSAVAPKVGVSLRLLLLAACKSIAPGEMRLIGWFDGAVPSVEVRPAVVQDRAASLVVAHLSFGSFSDPQTDVNARSELGLKPAASESEP